MPADRQQTFQEVLAVHRVQHFNPTQQRIARLLVEGYSAAYIAERIGKSRQYVSKTVKELEDVGLIQRHPATPTHNVLWEPSAKLKELLTENFPDTELTACRVHNIKLSYPILHQSGPVSLAKDAGYLRSWKPRGPARHIFCFPGKNGRPDVSLKVHPKTIEGYMDAKQVVMAETISEATAIIHTAIHEAVQKFIEKQRRRGVYLDLGELRETGKQSTKTHYGFPFPTNAPYAETFSAIPGAVVDNSPQDLGMPGYSEVEFFGDQRFPNQLDQAIKSVMALPSVLQPALAEALHPINQQLNQIQIQQDQNQALQAQVAGLTEIVGTLLKKLESMGGMVPVGSYPAPPPQQQTVRNEPEPLLPQYQ